MYYLPINNYKTTLLMNYLLSNIKLMATNAKKNLYLLEASDLSDEFSITGSHSSPKYPGLQLKKKEIY